jgi:hypothetical protein
MEMRGCEDPAGKTFKKLSCSGFPFDIACAGSRGETWTGRVIYAPLNQWLWNEILWPLRGGSDGFYVTTVWITALYIPILPLRSYRVLPVGKSFNVIIHRSQQFKVVRVPLCWEQVWHVYMISAPILIIIGWLIWSSAEKQWQQRGDLGRSVPWRSVSKAESRLAS